MYARGCYRNSSTRSRSREHRKWAGRHPGYPRGPLWATQSIEVSDDEIAEAIRIYFSETHTLAEGAGASPLAALMKERDRMQGRRIGLVLSGQNIDRTWMREVLAGETPSIPGERKPTGPGSIAGTNVQGP